MSAAEGTFIASLTHPGRPSLDRTIELPLLETRPPTRVRIPTEFEGAAAMDEYELDDAPEWPRQATYRHTGIVPQVRD
jgi:hypothetical protein